METEKLVLFKPPLSLLVDPTALRRVKPWQVNIATLLELFKRAVGQLASGLRLYGSAALASSVIYRMKVETILKVEPPRPPVRPSELKEPPFVIQLPFRQELYSTTVDDLLAALEKALREAPTEYARAPEVLVEPQPYPEADEFSVRAQEMLALLKERVYVKLGEQGEVMFSSLTAGATILEGVRLFILLLHLATRGEVVLDQVDDDIRVMGVGVGRSSGP